MSPRRVGLLLVVAVAVGAAAALLVEGNTSPVSLHLGSFAAHTEASLWLVVALAFAAGVITTGVLMATTSLSGPFFKILIGGLFILLLCAAGVVLGMRGAAGAALLVGLILLFLAASWELRALIIAAATGVRTAARSAWNRMNTVWNGILTAWNGVWAALNTVITELSAWGQGLTESPPVIRPPPSVIVLIILFLFVPALLGSTIVVRTELVLALSVAAIVAAWRAVALVRTGDPLELRSRYGGLGGSPGGWRLSQPASSLLIAAVLLGAAVGLAQSDRNPERQRIANATPAADTGPQTSAPASKTQAVSQLDTIQRETLLSAVSNVSSVQRQVMDQEVEVGRIQGRVENLNKTLDSLVGDIGNAKEAVRTVVNDLKAYVSSQKTGSTAELTKNEREELDGQIRQLSDHNIKISKAIDEINRVIISLKENDQKSIGEVQVQQKAIEENISIQQENVQLLFSRVEGTIKRSSQEFSRKLNDLNSGLDSIRAKVANHDVQLQKIELSTPCLPQSQTQMKAEHWRLIQQSLSDRGFDSGSADGRPGPNTQRAIRQFQAATGHLPVTGRLTAEEIKQLLPALNTPCPNSVGELPPWWANDIVSSQLIGSPA